MKIAQEEIFGPVLVVIRYKNLDDAIRIANGSIYGLGGAVWSRDADKPMQIAKSVRTGTRTVLVDVEENPLADGFSAEIELGYRFVMRVGATAYLRAPRGSRGRS